MPKVDWSSVGSDKKSGNGESSFLRLKEGKYRIRLLGNPHQFFQHFDPAAVICEGSPDKCPICKSGNSPKMRYATNVIDRADQKIKILTGGPQIFEVFKEYAVEVGDPGKKDGPDFSIKVEVPGGNKLATKYKTSTLDKKPLTQEEIAMINKDGEKGAGLHNLDEILKAKTGSEISEILQKDGNGGGEPDVDLDSAAADDSSDDDDFDF